MTQNKCDILVFIKTDCINIKVNSNDDTNINNLTGIFYDGSHLRISATGIFCVSYCANATQGHLAVTDDIIHCVNAL